jgi:hypothetical protein
MKNQATIFKITFFLLCISTIALTSFSDPAQPVGKTAIEKAGQFISPELAQSLHTTQAQIFSNYNIQELLEQPKAKALKVKYSETATVLVATDENGEELKLQLSFGIEPTEAISAALTSQ